MSTNHLRYFKIVIFLLFSFTSFSQQWVEMMRNPNVNFYETQAEFEAYWAGKTIQKGKGYKAFKRWEHYMEPRVYPSGNVTAPSQTYKNYKQWEADLAAAGIPKSTNGTWAIVGPTGKPANGGAGRVNFVRFDPTNSNTIWIGTPDGGLWKSTNGGTSWSTNTDQLTVIGCSDVAIDPTNSNTMYLATGDNDGTDTYSTGVLKSTDGGATWNTTGLNWNATQGRTIGRLLIHPTNPQILMAFTSAGIFRTTNGGTSWTNPTGTFACSDGEFKPGDPTTVYACGTSFKRSTDGGVTWTAVTTGLTGIGRLAMAVTEADPNYVYLLAARASDNGFLGLVRSTNSGAAFTTRMASTASNNILGWDNGADAGGQGWYDLAIAVSPTNAETVLTGGINIWKSTNGGTNFTKTSVWTASNSTYVHADIHDLAFLPGNGTTVFTGCDGGVFKTMNTGTAWSDLSSNLQIAQQYRISISTSNANLVLAGHQDNGSNLTTNGTAWAQKVGGDGMDCYIDRTTNTNMIASLYYGDYYRSTNSGASFTDITDPTANGTEEWVSPIHQDPTTSAIAYAGGRTKLYKCANIWGSVSWTALGTPSGSGNITEFAIAPSNNQIIYTLKSGTNAVARSINGGTSFTPVSTGLPTNAIPTWIAISNTDPNVAFVTYSGYVATAKIYKTTNGGTSWTNLSTGLPNVPVNCVVYHNGNSAGDGIYIGTDVGVYYRDNSMSSWVDFSSGLPNNAVSDLEIFYGTTKALKAGTFGRGTWTSDLYNSVPTPPVASFTANNLTICVGQSVQFTSTSSGLPTDYAWTFTGGSPTSSIDQNPLITYNTIGTYAVSLTVSNANGSNTSNQTNYVTVVGSSGATLPLVEGFTTTTFPPTGWVSINTDATDTTWMRSATVGFAPTAGNSMVFLNFYKNDIGNQDEMRTPKLNLAGYSAAQMTFNVAYAAYSATYVDGLEVLISTDCGTNWTSLYNKTGTTVAAGNLPTAALTTAVFIPTATQWRTETINLNAYLGQTSAILAFRNLAGYGNNLYIDNINITGTAVPTAPTASFTSTPSSTACTGQTVQYTSTSTGSPSSYAWTFTGGTPATSTIQNPTVTYATAGTYNVALTATNGAGSNTSTQNNFITVNQMPSLTGTTPGSVCGAGTVSLSATSSAGTINWFTAATGGTSIGTGSTWTTPLISATTTYYAEVTSNGCTSARTAVIATINPVPTATNPGNKTACVGLSIAAISFTGSSPSSMYAWTNTNTAIGLGASGSGNISAFTPSTAGTSTISITPTLNGCPGTVVTFTITVSEVPTLSSTTPASRCGTGTVSLIAAGSAGSTLNWFAAATGGTSLGSGTTFTTPSISTTTTYYVEAVIGGCSSGRTAVVATVNPSPTVNNPGNQGVCIGSAVNTISFTGSSASATYGWTNSNTAIGIGASGSGDIISFTPTSIGTATIIVTPTLNSCTGTPQSFVINVNAIPVVTVDLSSAGTPCVTDAAFQLTGGSPVGGTYTGSGVSNGSFNPALSGVGTQTITYVYTANGCSSSSSSTITVDGCSSIEDSENTTLVIFPNPTSGLLSINGLIKDQFQTLELIDVTGRICGNWNINTSNVEIDLTKFSTGTYNLIFKGKTAETVRRIEIKR
jgi:PKD repeat protein